ncbi:MAG TPA: Glu-tRNA(Gln) amidotransferase subunit GatE [Candidatus Thermoplasmatota archaeon]|nr:Glu-tRNA(Gln) amidotransferase subunit GatE [Candidatus Thermoplasmatota archaeon]
MSVLDHAALGFKAGLEIHQQLDTPKLFCRCPSRLDESDAADFTFLRALHPTASELGEVDRAAVEEARKRLHFEYLGSRHSACLVEADEEPPHAMSSEALDVALETALLLHAKPVDEVHIMRKIVVDGSNTSGFQRTSLVATAGVVESARGDVRMATFCLEEDSARRLDRVGNLQRYRLDRLGIPLIEIATEPDLKGPAHAREIAEAIGMALRATGKVKRGIGTIRQDVNISIREGARVEVKGVQELRLIETCVDWEVQRQVHLLDIKKELHARGAKDADYLRPLVDVGDLFAHSAAKSMEALKSGSVALAAALPHLAGLIGKKGKEELPPPRVGRELADYAKVQAGVKGIFHSDELPAYGLTPEECGHVASRLDLGAKDAYALVVAPRPQAERALHAVLQRAAMLLHGVPEETRDLEPDGTSRYLRPLPGGARMYPETDVPPVRLTAAKMEALRAALPEKPAASLARLKATLGAELGDEQITQIVRGWHTRRFDRLVKATGLPKETARVLLSTLPELEAKGFKVELATEDLLIDALVAVKQGAFAKEALPAVLRHAAEKEMRAADAAAALGLTGADKGAVRAAIDAEIQKNAPMVREQRERAASRLMGPLMGKFKGQVSGQELQALLAERIAAFLAS